MENLRQDLIKINQQCIIDCRVCLIKMAGIESKNDCPKCCIQCADACEALIKMITSDSAYVKQYALLCAEICEYCADHCEEHNHEHCLECAKSCRACAEACRKIA
ncbi:four-helix bundle copper-binding protein [Winogradskyella psychrotolerans]|uniref:four-helix bundle copper-binding protein n=1 Tax=Winogradskyella psychrotolerans TaxID=1344585 RepID=UPI001C079F94|nr:four-helix bundle copper-binding protein [Winogradskyella psychrotolerans]MBU2927162.1 four-helix bundle copper-binding protein [Winogradskyella psychrotolerans]